MEHKSVTVCIPVYNAEKYIKDTIDCVLNQTYSDVIVYALDNCSTDGTAAIIKSFDDSRVHYILNEKNVGAIGNFNRCLKQCRTEYIQILCADDYIDKDCINQKVAALEDHPDCALAFSSSYVYNNEGKQILRRKYLKHDAVLPGKALSRKAFKKRNVFGEPSNVLIRKECIDKAGEFNEALYYAADWD